MSSFEEEEEGTITAAAALRPEVLALLQAALEEQSATAGGAASAVQSHEEGGSIVGSSRFMAKHNSEYKEQEYWDARFGEEEEYDWLLTFDQVKDSIMREIESRFGGGQDELKILVVGCGNSSFSASLYDVGYHNITNIDYSSVVIEKMRKQHQEKVGMVWLEMDMTKMTFEDSAFDIVIDKAAMDAIMVDEGSPWSPHEHVVAAADAMCLCMRRVVKSNTGLVLMISFMQPHFRTKYLAGLRVTDSDEEQEQKVVVAPSSSYSGYCDRYDWTLTHRSLDGATETGCLNSFLYVMHAGEKAR